MLTAERLRTVKRSLEDTLCGNRVVFHHVPKTGGTSIFSALRRRYAISYASFDLVHIYSAMETLYPDDDQDAILRRTLRFREEQLLWYMFADRRCIVVDTPFSDVAYDRFNERYNFVTVLREPVSFFISTFFWNVNSAEDRWQIQQPPEEFVETPRARIFGQFYARFFRGLSVDEDAPVETMIERAKENLSRFAAVGLTEDMAGFSRRLSGALDVRIRIGHENKSKVAKPDRERLLAPEVRRRIEEISAPNIELYEFARSRLAG